MANAIEMQALKAKKKALEDRLKINPQDTVARKQLDEVDNQIFAGAEEAQLFDPTQMDVPLPRGTPAPSDNKGYPPGTETNKVIPPKVPHPGVSPAPLPKNITEHTDVPPDVKQDAQMVDSGKVPQVQNKINEVDLNPPKGDGDKLPTPPLKLAGLEPKDMNGYEKLVDTPASQLPKGDRAEPAEIPETPAQLADKPETTPNTPPQAGDTSGGGMGAQLENIVNDEQSTNPTPTDVVPPAEETTVDEPAPDTSVGQTVFEVPEDSKLNQQVQNQKTFEEGPYQVAVTEGAKGGVEFAELKGMDADKARASLGGLLELDGKQKAIIAEKEAKGKEQYDLMKSEFDRIEMRDFVDGVVQSLGTMLAGIVGLASDLPVGQYYKAVDVFDPTKSIEATKALYDAGMASLEDAQKEKLAQLKGVFDAMWSETPYKERMEYLKQMHDVTKSAVSSSQQVDNRPDAISQGTSTSTANKDAMTQAKEYADRAKELRQDKGYMENRSRLDKFNEILATGNASGLLDVNPDAKTKQLSWNEQLAKSGVAQKLNQPVEALLGEGIVEPTGGIPLVGWGESPSVWSTLDKEIRPPSIDPKTGRPVDPDFSGSEEALTRCAESISTALKNRGGVMVPDKDQIMEGLKMVRDIQHSNGLPITGQTLVKDTIELIKAGYAGGKSVNRVSDNELVIAEIANNYLKLPLIQNGFFTYGTVNASKNYLEQAVGRHESQIYEAEEQARVMQHTALTGGGVQRGGRVYPPLTDGLSPNEVEPQPSRGRGEWYGIYADEIPKAKVLPDGDIQLPPAWNNPKVISTVDAITAKYGMKPQELMALIALESAETFDPRALELGGTGATGIIQFVPSTAKGLAMAHKVPDAENWSAQDAQKWVAGLPLVNQLELVDTYLSQSMRNGGSTDAKGIYTAIFRGSNTNTGPITVATPGQAYIKNKPLDKNNDGRITYDEWTAKVTPYVEKYSKMKWGAKTQPMADNGGAQ